MKRLYIFFFLILPFCFPATALLNEIGINPFRTEAGIRPLGMGAAFSGLADDVNAAYYNPGGLAWAKGVSFSLRDLDNLSAIQAYPTGYGSSIGLAVLNTQFSDMPISGGVANSNSSVVLLSYGTKLGFIPALYERDEAFQKIGVGFNLKGLFGQTLRRTGKTDRSAAGLNMDLGALWKGDEWWTAGLVLQDVLPKMFGGGVLHWDVGGDEDVFPALKIAGSARVIGDIGSPYFMEGRELLLGSEIDFSTAYSPLIRLGGEWGITKNYYLRTGIMQQFRPSGAVASLNLGCGIRGGEWGADFASYHDPLRDDNRFSFSVSYFPKEWIVIKRLEVEKPGVVLENPFEKLSLEDNVISYDDKIEVFGKVKAGVEVYVDGRRAATTKNNAFKVIVPLHIGKNLVMVEARFEGDKKTWKYKVLRKAKIESTEEKEAKKELVKAKTESEKETANQKTAQLSKKKTKAEELVTLGVIEVTPEAEFKLEASITRAELATWLVKAAGIKLPKVDQALFLDVPKEHLSAAYIKAAVDWGLMEPFGDGTFRPASPVSKEEGDKLFKILGITKK